MQHLLKEDGKLLHDLITKQKAAVYLCGSTSMGRDCVAVLTELLATHGKLSSAQAAEQIKKMTSGGRLVQELY